MACLEKGQQILKAEPNVLNIQLDVFRLTCKCNKEVRASVYRSVGLKFTH